MHERRWVQGAIAPVSAGLSGQSVLVAWQVAGAFLRHPRGRDLVPFGNRPHAVSVSLFARAALRGP